MKIKSGLILFSTATIFALSGCTGGDSATAVPTVSTPLVQDPNACYESNVLAPNWVCNPSVEGGLGATGSAPKNPLGRGFQQTEAMADARDTLARELGTKVKNMFKSFAQSTGVGETQSVEKVATNVSKQISQQNIEGAKQKGRWQAPDGTLFVHVVLDPDGVQAFKETAKTIVKTSLKNDTALYQQFLAKKGMDELDAEIDKELGGN